MGEEPGGGGVGGSEPVWSREAEESEVGLGEDGGGFFMAVVWGWCWLFVCGGLGRGGVFCVWVGCDV